MNKPAQIQLLPQCCWNTGMESQICPNPREHHTKQKGPWHARKAREIGKKIEERIVTGIKADFRIDVRPRLIATVPARVRSEEPPVLVKATIFLLIDRRQSLFRNRRP